MSLTASEAFAIAQSRSMMLSVESLPGNSGSTAAVVTSMVKSSMIATSVMWARNARNCEPGLPRSMENATSSAVKSCPSWNLTPCRRVNRHVAPPVFSPARGEARHELEVLSSADEGVVDLGLDGERELLVHRMRIEGPRVALTCIDELRGVGVVGDGNQDCGGHQPEQKLADHGNALIFCAGRAWVVRPMFPRAPGSINFRRPLP